MPVGAVIDAFSRKVLAPRVSAGEPTAAFAVHLLRKATRENGDPARTVSDHGRQFTSAASTRALLRCGVRRLYGAVDRTGSIALIEGLWRTMREECARGLFLYAPLRAIERRLRAYALSWFDSERPHQGVGLCTLDDVFFERRRRRPCTLRDATLAVCFLGGDRELPVFRLRCVA